MHFYKNFTKYPFDHKNKINPDILIDEKFIFSLYEEFEPLINDFSSKLSNKCNIKMNTEVKYLIDSFKQNFNLLLKLHILNTIQNENNEDIIIDCNSQELDFFDEELNIKRFANIYAILGKELSSFTIENIGEYEKFPKNINNTTTDNIFLRVANLSLDTIMMKIKSKLKIKQSKKNKTIFTFGDTGLLREILPHLKNDFNIVDIKSILVKNYSNNYPETMTFKEAGKYFDKIFRNSTIFNSFNDEYYNVYKKIFLYININRLNKLIHNKKILSNIISELKNKYPSNILLSNGLFGTYGITISEAVRENNIKIVCTEHGLTTGLCGWRKGSINYYEPRTADYILTYNNSASKTYLSSQNKELICESIGAPNETKKIKNYLLQRIVSRRRLNVSGITVFYASLNLLTNNNTFYPYYMRDIRRYEFEKDILTKVFPNIKNDVIYKYYPSQNYLYEENPYISMAKESPNIKLAGEEDFRYIRTAADIIVTSNPSSTLGWCMGLDKPLVYLHNKYNPFENESILKAFEESFFVINCDKENWEEELINLLKTPYKELQKLWKEKEIYRMKYDEEYFLSQDKNPGLLGAKFIKELANG